MALSIDETLEALCGFGNLRQAVAVAMIDERDSGNKPGSMAYEHDTRFLRPHCVHSVATVWADISGNAVEDFPFHDDFVMTQWGRIRRIGSEHWAAIASGDLTITEATAMKKPREKQTA